MLRCSKANKKKLRKDLQNEKRKELERVAKQLERGGGVRDVAVPSKSTWVLRGALLR